MIQNVNHFFEKGCGRCRRFSTPDCSARHWADGLAKPNFDGELIQVAELNRGDIARGKYDFDVVGHYSRSDVFRLHVNEQAQSAVSLSGKQLHV